MRISLRTAGVVTGVYLALWGTAVLAHFVFDRLGLLESFRYLDPFRDDRIETAAWGILYLIGLCWTVILVERAGRRAEERYRMGAPSHDWRAALGTESNLTSSGWSLFNPASMLFSFWPSVIGFAALSLQAGIAWLLYLIFRSDYLDFIATAVSIVALVALVALFAQGRKLRQSLALFAAYSLFFLLLFFLSHLSFGGGDEIESELPAGGGSDSIKPTSVKVQKVVRKKYVINPYSSILFAAPPPIDKIELKLETETANQYKAGSGPGGLGKGAGKGGGFGSGNAKGKWELVRLRHSDKGWNKNFGVGGDRNLLAEIKAREPLVKIPDEDLSVDYATLARYSPKKPLALLYIGGVQTFAPSAQEKKILREYLLDKHGMVLGDNLGGGSFHNQFVSAMTEITGVQPVPVPRDDRIHQSPYALPLLPIVVAHGGTTPLGWKIDGRWAVYYHPGALSDAWRDDHAGIKKDVWESCYQLGINILYYTYVEQDSWREAHKGQ